MYWTKRNKFAVSAMYLAIILLSLIVGCLFLCRFFKDLILAEGSEGYPLSPAHTDLRDTETAASMEAELENFHRQNIPVDLSRSVW